MTKTHNRRCVLRSLLVAAATALGATHVSAKDDWSTVTPGTVVLFRHALAPGGGDPPGFQLNNCTTQRNLSEEGRAQARRIGEAFQRRAIDINTVWTSQWCRTRETADIAFPGKRVDQPLFNSFFNTAEQESGQTREALNLMGSWQGTGVLVVVTHQVNITALTGIVPDSGDGVVIALRGRDLKVLGRITPAVN